MSRTRGRNRWLTALAAALLLAAGGARAQGDAAGPRAPVLLFITGDDAARLPAPVAEVRTRAVELLETSLAARGIAAVPTADLMPELMAARVRSPYAVSAAFTADLAARTGATHLLVASLMVQRQHLQLLARLVHLPTMTVVATAHAEATVPAPAEDGLPDAAAWFAGLRAVCGQVRLDAAAPTAAGPTLVVLPARAVGGDADLALAATYSVLASAAADGRLRVIDPGVAATALQAAGVRPEYLDAAGRRVLTDLLDEPLLLAPEMLVYGVGVTGGYVDPSAGSGTVDQNISAYDLTLRLVDARSGVITANFTRHEEHGARVGWFGVVDDTSVLAGLDAAARTLWQQLGDTLEER